MKAVVVLVTLVLLALCEARPTIYNKTIKLELNEIFTYSLPDRATLYYNLVTAATSRFSIRAISEDENKQPYYIESLASENTSLATLKKQYQLQDSFSNLHLMVINENLVDPIHELHVFIEYDTGSITVWANDHWAEILGLVVLSFFGITIISVAIVLIVRRRLAERRVPLINDFHESSPLIPPTDKDL